MAIGWLLGLPPATNVRTCPWLIKRLAKRPQVNEHREEDDILSGENLRQEILLVCLSIDDGLLGLQVQYSVGKLP